MSAATGLDAIRDLYYAATPKSIAQDLDAAIRILKEMPEEARDKAAVYMEGLAEMRREWLGRRGADDAPTASATRPTPRASAPSAAAPRARSGRSTAPSHRAR